MTYKIFVSHTESDTPIAKAISKVINDAFQGQIHLYLAADEVVGGVTWKRELKENLECSDAIISIVTPDSIRKPWIYVEWSPFWLSGKMYYTLVTNQIKVSDLIQPMHDRQTINITDKTQVTRFFKALGKESQANIPVPYEEVDTFIESIEQANLAKLENTYGIFRRGVTLPDNDIEKKEIANYFYQIGEIDVFQRIVSTIRDDTIKTNIIFCTISDSKLDYDVELRMVYAISKTMQGADKLGYIAIELIKMGNLDAIELLDLLQDLRDRNQAELRKVAIYLVSVNQEDTELFSHICNLLTNFAELRKVALYFIANNRYESVIFAELIKKISAPAQLRHIATEFIQRGYQKSSQFEKIIEILFALPGDQNLTFVMEELFKYDKETYKRILDNQSNDRKVVQQFRGKLLSDN